MKTQLSRVIRHIWKPLLSCALLAATCAFGCQPRAARAAVLPEGEEPGGIGLEAAQRVRAANFKSLRALWAQRRTSRITPRVLPFLKSPLRSVRLRAVVMLGRLEDPRALKPLQALRPQAPAVDIGMKPSSEGSGGTLYPELPLAIGRIKARNLSGRRKLDTMLAEVGSSFGGVAALSKRIHKDPYWRFYLGNRVIERVVDVLAGEREKGRDVGSLASRLTLSPTQRTRITAVSSSPAVEAEKILDYVARAWEAGDPALIERLLSLGLPPKAVLDKVSAKLHNRRRYPDPAGLAQVLQEMAVRQNTRALAMLRALANKEDRPLVRAVAQAALNALK